MGTRKKFSVLVRTPSDREVHKIGPDSTIVEHCISLTRRAIADNTFAGPLRLDQEFQKLALGFAHSRFEVSVVTERGYARVGLAFAESKKAIRWFLGRVLCVTRINAYRAAMSRELFDIKDREAMRGENAFRCV